MWKLRIFSFTNFNKISVKPLGLHLNHYRGRNWFHEKLSSESKFWVSLHCVTSFISVTILTAMPSATFWLTISHQITFNLVALTAVAPSFILHIFVGCKVFIFLAHNFKNGFFTSRPSWIIRKSYVPILLLFSELSRTFMLSLFMMFD